MSTIPADPKNPEMIDAMRQDSALQSLAARLFNRACDYRYSYNFTWLGIPIIQFPQDIVAIQELIWSVQPDVVIETGVAHGGSLILSASILQLLGGGRLVIGIDVDIRRHNRERLEQHPLASRLRLLEGSSTAPKTLAQVRELVGANRKTMVFLDSNHTHEHVLKELNLYSPFVRKGSYLVVFDTVIEHMPVGSFPNRDWDIGNSPLTAVSEFLARNRRFEIDKEIHSKLLLSVAPDGYLKCIGD
jgi:cephalosporin hydroxylase